MLRPVDWVDPVPSYLSRRSPFVTQFTSELLICPLLGLLHKTNPHHHRSSPLSTKNVSLDILVYGVTPRSCTVFLYRSHHPQIVNSPLSRHRFPTFSLSVRWSLVHLPRSAQFRFSNPPPLGTLPKSGLLLDYSRRKI